MTSPEYRLNPIESPVRLRPLEPDYPELCEKAEPRVMCALKYDGAIALTDPLSGDPLMVYKIVGKPVALSVKNVCPNPPPLTMSGRHIWYNPDRATQALLEKAYDRGVTVMPVPEGSTWAQMRSPTFAQQGYPDDQLDTISTMVRAMVENPAEPTVVVNDKHGEPMSKHEYRLSCYEDITVGDAPSSE